jgi:hypothetical protein
MTSDQNELQRVTLQGQMIVGALIAGVSIFLVIATFVRLDADAGVPGSSVPILTCTALVFAAVILPMSFIVPGLVAKQQRQLIARKTPSSSPRPAMNAEQAPVAIKNPPLALAYLNQLIIGAAMNEGGAFLAGVAYLVERNPIALAVALALVAALVARFPTLGRIERWIEQQAEKLREDQLQAPSAF